MKNQTLSIEQMKHLKNLGVDVSKASMVYHTYKDITDEWVERDDIISSHFKIDENSEAITSLDIRSSDERLYHDMNDCSNYSCCEFILAFTLQDILEMMPVSICDNSYYLINTFDELIDNNKRVYTIRYESIGRKDHCCFESDSLIDASYQMLCWVASNGHLKGDNQ